MTAAIEANGEASADAQFEDGPIGDFRDPIMGPSPKIVTELRSGNYAGKR